MKLISLKIKGFKNLYFWETPLDFTKSEGISIFIGNNGSGKSNILEAISAIFYGLYFKKTLDFDFELKYKKSENEILIKNGKKGNEKYSLTFSVDGQEEKSYKSYLPSQIIALYSGEETRLYERYYLSEYESYVNGIISGKKNVSEIINMIFIGKDFWNIALLTMFASEYGLSEIIGKYKIDKLSFTLNEENLNKFSNKETQNEVTGFVKGLSEIENINFESFKNSPVYRTHKELFKLLSIAHLPKEKKYKLIENFDLELTSSTISENKFWASCLSEGQKKQILIYFVTEILADNDSIILLDEPDAYIHVGNKKRLKEFFEKFLSDRGGEGEVIMTTHSPTLMNSFDEKHLFYLEEGKLDQTNKRNILDKITEGEMTMIDMEIFLNSKNKYLLVTEGKTDKKHLETAINKLGIENNFDIYPADGCDKLKQFLIGLPTDILSNKIIIGIFDYDESGIKSLKGCGTPIEENKIYKVSSQNNRYGISLPCLDENFERLKNQPIEFLYSKEVLDQYDMLIKQDIKTINSKLSGTEQINHNDYEKLNQLYYFNLNDSKKNDFANKCKEFSKEKFEGFKSLFDRILVIKGEE